MTKISELIRACEDSEYATAELATLADRVEHTLRHLPRPAILDLENELGRDPVRLVGEIRDAASPQVRADAARMLAALSEGCACSGDEPPEPTFTQEQDAAESLGKRAIAPIAWAIKKGLIPDA